MTEMLDAVDAWFGAFGIVHATSWIRAVAVAVFGIALAYGVSVLVGRAGERLGAQLALIARRLAFWTLLFVFAASALRQVGFDLSVVLGAAGVVTVGLGFASQTSASNVISGLFLLAEQPFAVGDIIQIGTTKGAVLSIDLLSVKLRTFDNLFVRVPNEAVMRSEIVNLSRFAVRRFDLHMQIDTDMPLSDLRQRLIAIADDCALALDEPRPFVFFDGIAEGGARVQLSVWATQETFFDLRNELVERVCQAFADLGIAASAPRLRVVGPRSQGSNAGEPGSFP